MGQDIYPKKCKNFLTYGALNTQHSSTVQCIIEKAHRSLKDILEKEKGGSIYSGETVHSHFWF